MVRNRVITLRLWLQLWDTQTGEIVWESSRRGHRGERDPIARANGIPLDEIGQKLWLRMIQDDLLGGRARSRFFF